MNFYKNPHPPGCFWHEAAEKVGAPNIKWCEETLCSVVSEPANTWSNILYMLLALWMLKSAKKKGNHNVIWLAPAMFLMGFFSFIYHMSNNYVSQVFDFVGMYLFIVYIVAINLSRLNLLKSKYKMKFMWIISTVLTIIVHFMYISHIKFQFIVVILVLAIVITEFLIFKKSKEKIDYKYFFVGLFFVALAQAFSQLDLHRIMCDPQNHFIQGHALWHISGAIGLAFAYKYYESLNLPPA